MGGVDTVGGSSHDGNGSIVRTKVKDRGDCGRI